MHYVDGLTVRNVSTNGSMCSVMRGWQDSNLLEHAGVRPFCPGGQQGIKSFTNKRLTMEQQEKNLTIV